MGLGLHTWLIIIGVIAMAAILFDGWRRISGNKLKFDLTKPPEDDEGDSTSSEILSAPRVVKPKTEPKLSALDDLAMDEPTLNANEDFSRLSATQSERITPTETNADDSGLTADKEDEPSFSATEAEAAASKKALEPSEVLVIIVLARSPLGFKGPDLLQSILSNGLRYGDMDIFHRYTNMTGHGDTLFSMANAVAPGTFDLETINDFKTPAVSFFMQLPGPSAPAEAFELMLEAATHLATSLGGDLKDDQASVLTTQTVEHYRQRIANFEFKQRQLRNKLQHSAD
ncbi:hypothetical protein AKN87_03620 [Thiopseudomonas alkaliphila]|uniref:cell division protein ZipA n=1 Tax=Thiopseudomonas alkaliphila TaxID=1697053 RepID=UPI00069F6A21|nr:cell division protein ZipA [Thiopseudomonas alkaliphila]AKX44280.1 hypothetical protein AKN87_03620 [Thiopseudomonas alkaliphila]AKX50301.1 hypothetical protein AKN92_01480 [Thiopseudomonas alkaliphila]AKX52539.1 hypothetical protein AKN91_01725 [Thiopseudomonas alkaliphila]AKX54563.1 hypothetical protein AKN90_01700 [Thiopseudomonas alkaliphila]AKX56639.1 hypothetical protein AKN89_01475 [Thiopseudomonas alkaliphila]